MWRLRRARSNRLARGRAGSLRREHAQRARHGGHAVADRELQFAPCFAVEFGFEQAPIPGGVGLDKDSILKQVRTVLSVLKCWRGVTSATYREGGALVTHSESVYHDL